MGISYHDLDKILYYHLEQGSDMSFIIEQGISSERYAYVMEKIKHSAFKRRLPLTLEKVWE
jgi:NH3-dependent NAD+ synthetase